MSPADTDEKWSIGSKFRPSAPAGDNQSGGRFGSVRGRGDMGPPLTPSVADESDWRKPRPGRNSSSRMSLRISSIFFLVLFAESDHDII